jgi:hypothetical protein
MIMKKYILLLFATGGYVFGEGKMKFDNFVYRKL